MAAGSTYTPISSTTLSSNVSNFSITGIPSTYTDLELILTLRGTVNGVYPAMQIGGSSIDTGTNYSQTSLYGINTGAGSQRYSNNGSIEIFDPNRPVPYTASVFGISRVVFPNYANTNVYKTVLVRGSSMDSSTGGNATALVGLWRSTNAISQLYIFSEGGSSFPFASGSTIALYGILAA